MERHIEEMVTTERNVGRREASGPQTIEYIVYFILGVIEILLMFRFIFKVLGANASSGFVNFIYDISDIFVLPFVGIFSSGTAQGVETTAVFEPATLVAMLVYAAIGWGIVRLVQVLSGQNQN